MFDLDGALARWRRQMGESGVTRPEVLDELESHVRDEVEEQLRAGRNAERAFVAAIERLGEAALLKREFGAVSQTAPERLRDLIFTLAGIPNTSWVTTMNTSYIEPRWATYLKAVGFLAPAIFLATVSAIWVVPKLQQICRDAGLAGLPAATAGTFWSLTYSSIQTMLFFANYGVLIAVVLIAVLALLEWRSRLWPRYRRATVGLGAFLINSIVLIALFVMFLAAIMAAPGLPKN